VAVAAAAIVAIAAVEGGAFAPRTRVLLGVLVAVVAVWAAVRWRGGLVAEEWLGLSVVLWASVSAAAHRGNLLAAKELVTVWLVAWLLFVITRRGSGEARRSTEVLLVVSAVGVSLAVLAECFGAGRFRMGGSFANPNVAAALIVSVVPTAWRLWRQTRDRWAAAVVLVLVGGVLATGSRAGVLALVVVVALVLPRGRVRNAGLVAAVAMAVALMAWRFLIHPDSLAWHRVAIWRALAQLVAANPLLGVGPGLLEEATGVVRIPHAESVARFRHVIGSAESTPLGLLVQTGMVGFGLAVAALVVWLRNLTKARLQGDPTLLSTIAAVAVVAAFHDVLDQGIVLWWWAVVVAMVAPELDLRIRAAPRPVALIRVMAAWAAAGLVLWGMAQPAYARRIWWSDRSSEALASRAVGAEPWLTEPARWRVRDLLRRSRWSWMMAGEALHWSERVVTVHTANAGVWSERALVNARIAGELGPWPDAVDGARAGFRRATELEPHLPWHWLRWAQFERSVGDLDEAARLARRALVEEPRFVRGWLFLARVEADRGGQEQARLAVEQARTTQRLVRWRLLSDYERDLTRLPRWQLRELERELAGPPPAVVGGAHAIRDHTP
jgi:O-antigen ligase